MGGVSLQSESGEGRELTGDGTKEDPYQIATAEQLEEFADKVNDDGETTANAELTADINLSDKSWTPIGRDSFNPYSGTFNGAGHTISGLYIDSSDSYQGLFGSVSGTVKDLSVSGSVSGRNYVGGVVGYNSSGTVENCYNTGSVKGDWYVGGVVGQNDATVENCYNTGDVSGRNYVGGVVGLNNQNGTVKNCYNTGAVSGSEHVGGVVGYNYGDSVAVDNCFFLQGTAGSGIGTGGTTGATELTAEEFADQSKFSSWDFTNTWEIEPIFGRPTLQDNAEIGGTANNPYKIFTATQLAAFHDLVNGEGDQTADTDAHAKLMNNIDLKDVCGPELDAETSWTPIGTSEENAYTGTFNGQNFKISGLYLNSNTDYQGLFGYVGTSDDNKGTVQNLTVEGSITVTAIDHVGGIVAYNNGGSVTNCTNEAFITGSIDSPVNVGGVVGYNYSGTVENCYNTGDVSGNTSGGVVGQNWSSVTNCYNTGNISGNTNVGGVVGDNSGTVSKCYNTGSVSVSSSGTGTVGGVVGDNKQGGSVQNSYNTGDVSCTYKGPTPGPVYVGGVVGYNNSKSDGVTNCYNTGDITGTGASNGTYVGGIVGYNSSSAQNSYNNGNVSGTGTDTGDDNSDINVGGIVGRNFGGSVQNCYNIDSVSGTVMGSTRSTYVGGVVGQNLDNGSVQSSYNTASVTGTVTGTGSNYIGGVAGSSGTDCIVANCYYMESVASKGIGDGNGTKVEEKTAEQFSSGEVAYLLQKEQTAAGEEDPIPQVWGQNIVEDKSPVLTSDPEKTVYKVTINLNNPDSTENKTRYTNSDLQALTPTREGYTFGGWYADKDCTGERVTTITADTSTLYAKWTKEEPTPDPEPTPEEPPYSGKYSYEVFTSVGDNGTVSVDRYATEGDTVTIQVTPDQAYKLDDLSVTANGKDVELTANGDGTYSFTMPSADVKITATFAEDPDWTEPEPEEPSTDVSDIFIDVAPNAWYKDAVQYAYAGGLMTGVSDTEFAPEATTTRAMIVSTLARLENVTSAESAGFADVSANDWYATAVNWAANVGVVNGYEDNTFKPNTAITREQLAAILMNYASYKGEDVSARADLSAYTDQPSAWAEETMSWAVAEGLITGVTNDELQPQGNATRAQVAAILQRYLDK